jgi:hypothetical protein
MAQWTIYVLSLLTVENYYKYYVSGHYTSSCFYLKHRLVHISKYNVSETGFFLLLQAKPDQLVPINRACPYRPKIRTSSIDCAQNE